jgi:GMP synthase (glutamine-hydrolysing)
MKKITFVIGIVCGIAFGASLWLYLSRQPNLLIVDNGTIAGSDLEKYLQSRGVTYTVVKKSSQLAEIAGHAFKGIILTGGPLLYSSKSIDVESINIDTAVLLNFDCPVLGICFGHQTIVELFGGKICRLAQQSKGMQNVKILKYVEIFKGLPEEVAFKQNHYDCGTEIPHNFDLIATSDVCFAEGIKHLTKPIFGVQFHPEGSGEYGYLLLDNFLRLCGCLSNA